MPNQDVAAIRTLIANAKNHEANTGHLHLILEIQRPFLHSAIQLPGSHASAALADFVTRYIDHVPDFIEAIQTLASEAGIESQTRIFLDIATDYLLSPPPLIGDRVGLEALVHQAYLAHRLIEELNDRFIGRCGAPLAPMDMTRANLIVHSLIGERFANKLDLAVHYSVEILMQQDNLFESEAFRAYVDQHREGGWAEELERWPCLADDLAIHLDFNA